MILNTQGCREEKAEPSRRIAVHIMCYLCDIVCIGNHASLSAVPPSVAGDIMELRSRAMELEASADRSRSHILGRLSQCGCILSTVSEAQRLSQLSPPHQHLTRSAEEVEDMGPHARQGLGLAGERACRPR
jgi:hypothetical protein